MVDELASVASVDAADCVGDCLDELLETAQHGDASVVADRAGEHPSGQHVGEVHRPDELALQAGFRSGQR